MQTSAKHLYLFRIIDLAGDWGIYIAPENAKNVKENVVRFVRVLLCLSVIPPIVSFLTILHFSHLRDQLPTLLVSAGVSAYQLRVLFSATIHRILFTFWNRRLRKPDDYAHISK